MKTMMKISVAVAAGVFSITPVSTSNAAAQSFTAPNAAVDASMNSAGGQTLSLAASAEAARCSWGANPPYLSGRTVNASVWSSSCPGGFHYTGVLQRKRWYGWQDLASKSWYGSIGFSLSKGCKAGTTFTYRSYVVDGVGTHKFSPQRRFKCR
ncbi:hypothetical protein [Microtetraspora malaysiensis]|uniref:hypothetical protein n=1 Tax=Microtetraspora malaysiensis TaxID=161358 RepID=UPI00082CEC1B|nr:hypothetical protein [Microtetraspora malaysiensis]